MKKLNIIIILSLMFSNSYSQNDEEEFKPSGSPFVSVFSNFHSNLIIIEDQVNSAFEIKRVYLGYKYKMSEKFSAIANIEVSNPENGSSSGYAALLKFAALTYKIDKLSFDFGLINLKQFKFQENFWGHRYIYKSFQHENKYGYSADLGASVSYKLLKFLSVDATIMNGEGYKNIQSDDSYKGGFGLTIGPIDNLTLRAYYDIIQKESIAQTSIAIFLGYNFKEKIYIGVENNMQYNNECQENYDLFGISAYASYDINEKFEIFGRFDELFSSTISGSNIPWNQSKNGYAVIGGVQYAPVKGIKVAINYQGWTSDVPDTDHLPRIYLNLEYKFN